MKRDDFDFLIISMVYFVGKVRSDSMLFIETTIAFNAVIVGRRRKRGSKEGMSGGMMKEREGE